MQLRGVLIMAVAGAISHTSAASNVSLNHPLNGWYPCNVYTFSDAVCYPGVCEDVEYAEPTVDIFVKRLPATAADTKTALNIWLLQGGPGYSSTTIRCLTVLQLRSRRLALGMKFGDLASFSTTSAATGVSTFISNFSNRASSIIYGVSYGTVMVERLMHLTRQTLMDTFWASGSKFSYFLHVGWWCWRSRRALRGAVYPSQHVQHTFPVNESVRDTSGAIDNDPNSSCATLLSNSIRLILYHQWCYVRLSLNCCRVE
ncbi:hypothetical protein JG688_00016188 [Phytophthora aleatoria]|uniref:Uncharacterized protein n=1 Tax=Phytophthora aleatoria TaxID=2496075 RepID=A0A8J5MCL4_9STRA|nr:hypothetical protein JG688_00016188 [Phytophthora aleatoria]